MSGIPWARALDSTLVLLARKAAPVWIPILLALHRVNPTVLLALVEANALTPSDNVLIPQDNTPSLLACPALTTVQALRVPTVILHTTRRAICQTKRRASH